MESFESMIRAAEELAQANRWAEAASAYQRILQQGVASFGLHLNLGIALLRCGRIPEARDQYAAALALEPEDLDALDCLVDAELLLGESIQAEARCRKVLECHPEHLPAWNNLGVALVSQGRIPEGIQAFQHTLDLAPTDPTARGNLLLSLNFVAADGVDLAEVHRMACADIQAGPRKPLPRVEGRRIRVGYVSCDLRNHSVAYFLSPLVGTHDRSAFEITCYSTFAGSDWMTENFIRMSEHFVDLSALSDAEAARRIAADGIDILVDLGGHTQGSRLGIFALRPAPVQVTYLGYPATTGCAFMDYRMVDGLTDPEGAEALSTEQLIRLPAPFLCYHAHPDCPEVTPLPALSRGHITFGSFSAAPKISEDTLDLWSRVLLEMPTARLYLKTKFFGHDVVRGRYVDRFAARGIDPSRLTLVGHLPNTLHHLSAYGEIDVALDTYPYHGTTTTCEALWMGVPVVSLVGDLHAARVGRTLLEAVHLEGLATRTPEDYLAMAVGLASDPQQLAALRRRLRQVVASSPLCDRFRLTRAVEEAYRSMLAPETTGGTPLQS